MNGSGPERRSGEDAPRREWPALMKPATARAYLDNIGAEKFRAEVAPHLTPRWLGERIFYRKDQIDRFILGIVDGEANPGDAPSPREHIDKVRRDLAERKGRQARHRKG